MQFKIALPCLAFKKFVFPLTVYVSRLTTQISDPMYKPRCIHLYKFHRPFKRKGPVKSKYSGTEPGLVPIYFLVIQNATVRLILFQG